MKYGEVSGELVNDGEILSASQEIYGTDTYGQLAIDIIARLRRQAFISVNLFDDYFSMSKKGWVDVPNIVVTGLDHNSQPGETIGFRRVLTGGAAQSATTEDIQKLLFELLEDKPLYFDYVFSDNPGARLVHDPRSSQKAFMVPISLSKEALGRYMTSRRDYPHPDNEPTPSLLSEHQLHGSVGRALDVLLYISGVKQSLDPAATQFDDEYIDYDEFRQAYLKYFTTKSARSNFRLNTLHAVRDQLDYGRPRYYPFEIVTEGATRIRQPGGISIDKISVSSLKEYGRNVQKKTIGLVTERMP